MEAREGDTVKVHYKARSDEEIIFDTFSKTAPLQVTIGEEQVIPDFEEALIGMHKGETKSIKIPAENAFGPYIKELVSTVERSEFPTDLKLKIGQQLQLQQENGNSIIVTVKDLSNTQVTLDANHPLAGKDLTFDIKLIDIL